MAEALPWIAGMWNEHTAAEILNDPLIIAEKFNLGGKVASQLMTSVGTPTWNKLMTNGTFAKLANDADRIFIGTRQRNAARLGREMALTHDNQLQNLLVELNTMEKSIIDEVGADGFEQLKRNVQDAIETAPEARRVTEENARVAADKLLEEIGRAHV